MLFKYFKLLQVFSTFELQVNQMLLNNIELIFFTKQYENLLTDDNFDFGRIKSRLY